MPGDERIDVESVERFIQLAVEAGVINSGTAQRLRDLAQSFGPPPALRPEVTAAAATLDAVAAFLADPAASRLRPNERDGLARESGWLRHALQSGDPALVTQSAARLAALLAAARSSLAAPPPPAPRPSRPVPVAAPPALRPQPVAPPAPVVPRRPPGPSWSERAQRRLGKLGRAVGSDFAIHGITYLGVLLALVVLVVFFTVDNYFGRTFGIPWTRPFIFMLFPAVFFVLGWVLRHKSGIPQAAIAIELIGAVLVPAMVAALFRDGYSIPPNAEQLWRWAVYAGSAVPAVVVFWLLARRRRLYAYLVAPTVWTLAGALGLYLHFHWVPPSSGMDRAMPEGMSAYQVILILATMAATVVVATLIRRSALGRLVSAPTVRMAVATAPFVLLAAVQFAYSDALLEGPPGVGPGLTQMGLPLALAAAAGGAIFLAARWAGFAWEGLAERARQDVPAVIAVMGALALAVAPALGLAEVVPLSWVGAILCATGVALAAVEKIPGFGSRSGSWVGAAAAVAGLALSLGGGGATLAAWGLAAAAVGVFPGALRLLFRTPALSDKASRLVLGATTLVALGAGAARLAWPEGTAWVLVGSAGALAATRWAKALPAAVRSLGKGPAVVLVAAALGVAAARAALGDGPGFASSGALVLAAGVVVFLVDMPWPARLLPGTALLVAGGLVEVRPALEGGAWVGAAADAGVLGGLGLVLVADALLRRTGRFRLWHSALGHLLMVASLARSLPFERSALAGLGLFFAAAAAEAAAVEADGSPLIARLAARPGGAGRRALPAAAAAAVLPFITVLAGRRIPAVALEPERRGLILAVTALGMAAAVLWWRRRALLRSVAGAAATAVALAGVALAAPSPTGLVLATGAAALSTAAVAVGCRLPWAVALPWAGAAGTFLLGLWRGGVAPIDLRYGMIGAGALLAAGPAVIHWRRGRPVPRLGPWLRPPLVEGLALLSAAVVVGMARPRLLWLLAVVAAGVVAFVGWSLRAGVASFAMAAALTIAYAHLLQGPWPPFEDGVRFMPLAAALVGASLLLPGRRAWLVLSDASSGTLLSGLAVAALGVGVGAFRGGAAPALLCLAGLLAVVWAARRQEAWLYAALLTALVGGLAGAPDWTWLAATAAADALILGILAVRRAEQPEGRALAWLAAALAAVAFGALTDWGAWATFPLLAASASAAAGALAAATILGLPRRWAPGVALWQLPAAALAIGAEITLMSQGHLRLAVGALGVDAGALAAAALAAGLVATGRVWPGMAAVSSLLAAAAYGCLAGWGDWPAETVVGVTAAVGGALAVGAVVLSLRPDRSPRIDLWTLPLHALAQVAAVTVAAVALAEFGAPGGLGVVSGVLAFEALLAGLLGTCRRWPGLVAASAVFTAGAYGCLAGWLRWDAGMVVGVTGAVGGVLLVAATALTLQRTVPARLALWRWPLHALAQAAAVTVAVAALAGFEAPEGLGVVAGVLAAEALVAGLLGTVWRAPVLVGGSAALAAAAYGCLGGWLGWHAGVVAGVTAVVGAALAVTATALTYWRAAPARAALWRWPLQALTQAAAVTVAAAALSAFGAPAGLGAVSAVLAAEALLAGVAGTVERRPGLVAVAAGCAAGAYGFLAGWLEWSTGLVLGVTAAVGAALAVAATALSYRRAAPAQAALWCWPLHGLAQAAAVAVALTALNGYGPARVLTVLAAVCAFEAGYVAANARWLPAAAGPRWISAEFAVAAVFLALGAVAQAGRPAGLWVQGAAALALVVAVGYGLARPGDPWRSPAGAFAAVVAPGAAIAAAWIIGAPYAHTAAAIAFGGADLVAVGLLTRRIAFVEGGLVAWVGAGLMAFHEHLDITSHLTVVPVAVALLAVVEVERGRRRREGREPSSAALRLFEWALMLCAPALCVADAAGNLVFLVPLAAEGAVLMAWGILTEVRRRALLGVGVMAAAILLAAIIPLSRGLQAGLSGGTWLAIGAGAAALLIALGSILERQRRRLGRALAAAGRAMEGWE